MSRNYDNWERLVVAVLDREKLRQLAREPSFDSITSDFSSCFSFDSTLDREYAPEAPKPISYDELKKATRNFRPVPLVGDCGSQYNFKGWIDEHTLTAVKPGSGLAITVKLMPERFQDLNEWMSKVNYLGQLRHPNLIKLMGYCSKADRRFLVYEFMPRGSLGLNLLDLSEKTSLNQILSWETRVNVAIDVARALSFLHETKPPVIHEHVKASTILLDKDFNAKLEVFTSDEPEPGDQLAVVLNRGDTPHPSLLSNLLLAPHQPPEYLYTGDLTTKNDVYSFGVVLLRLLSGRRAIDREKVPSEQNLVDWAKPHLSDKRKLFRIMDPKLGNQYSNEGAGMLAAIALQCLSPDPKLRPSMMKVLADMKPQKLKSKSRK